MKNLRVVLALLSLLCVSSSAFAVLPTLILKNQFGEQSNNTILGGSGSVTGTCVANTVVSNITGSTAAPLCNTYAAVSAKLTPAMLLTGFVSGAGTVAATDTVLQAFNKLAGNTQNKAILSFLSNVSAGGSANEVYVVTGLLSTDTVIAVSQSIKGANSLPLLGYNTVANNALTGVYSADPGANAKIVVTVLR